MELPLYQVDAFADAVFGGNPAAVVPLKEWLPDETLQLIAIENNLSETAYFMETPEGPYLRWFTPSYEVDLCGHATMASAYVYLFELYPEKTSVTFKTNVAGDLTVTKNGNILTMDFPQRAGEEIAVADVPAFVLDALTPHRPVAARKARDLMLIYDNEDIVRTIEPDFMALKKYAPWISVTAPSKDFDFVSRFYCSDDSLLEDPVTGSAHCTLAPYWADRLGKTTLKGYQASARGGVVQCEIKDGRVFISGSAVLYMKGTIYV
jgi:PhzF family phenazine biosynthesis protein